MSIFSTVWKKTFLSAVNKELFVPLALSALVTTVILTIIVFLITVLFSEILDPLFSSSYPWVQKMIHFGTTGGAVQSIFLLFSSLIPAIGSPFENTVAQKIQHQDYPGTPVISLSRKDRVKKGLLTSAKILGINCVLLPLYLMHVLNVFTYIPINGYILGKMTFLHIATHYRPYSDAMSCYKQHRRIIWMVGMILSIISYLDFMKLLAPFIAIVVMVHLSHTLKFSRP